MWLIWGLNREIWPESAGKEHCFLCRSLLLEYYYVSTTVLAVASVALLETHHESSKAQNISVLMVFASSYILRFPYEQGSPHSRFRCKPEALSLGWIYLSVFRIDMLSYGMEPSLFQFDRNALPLHPYRDYPVVQTCPSFFIRAFSC
jgi:hypothetical protein